MKQLKIDIYNIAYQRDNWQCKCGQPAMQIGHCIDNTITNIRVYGRKIIENHNNLRAVCSLKCNTKVRVSKENERKKLAELISKNIYNILTVEYMNEKIKE